MGGRWGRPHSASVAHLGHRRRPAASAPGPAPPAREANADGPEAPGPALPQG